MAIKIRTMSNLAISKLKKSQVNKAVLQDCTSAQVKWFSLDVVKDLSKDDLLIKNHSGNYIFSQLGQDQLNALTNKMIGTLYGLFTSDLVALLSLAKVLDQSTSVKMVLVPLLSGKQLNALSKDQLNSVKWLISDAQLAILSASQFSLLLTIADISISPKKLYGLMTPSQAAGLSVAQIKAWAALNPSPLTPQHIAKISIYLISQLEAGLVHKFAKSLSVEQIKQLTGSQVTSVVSGIKLVERLTAEQIQSLSFSALKSINSQILNAKTSEGWVIGNVLTLDQVKSLSGGQVDELLAYGIGVDYKRFILELSAAAVQALSASTLLTRVLQQGGSKIYATVLEMLTPTQMRGVSSSALDTLAGMLDRVSGISKLSLLSDLQIQNINVEFISGLTNKTLLAVGLSGRSIFSLLTQSQLGRLSSTQVKGLVASITPDQIGLLSSSVLGILDGSVLRAWLPNLSSSQLFGLKIGKLKDLLSLLTENQLGAMPSDFFTRYPDCLLLAANKLSVNQISNLSALQLNQVFLNLDIGNVQLLTGDTLSKLSASTMVSQAKNPYFLGATPIGALTAKSINKWATEVGLACLANVQIQSLSADTVGGLDSKVLRMANSFGNALLSVLSIAQTKALTAKQINEVAAGPGGLNRLMDLQVQSLSENTVSGLDSIALRAQSYSGRIVFDLLTISQMKALTGSQLNLVFDNPAGIFITEAQVANLSASAVGGLEVRFLLALTSNGRTILSLLTDAQRMGLTADQQNQLINIYGVSCMTDLQIANLSAQAVGKLTVQTLLARNAGGFTVLQMLSDIQKQYLTAKQVNLLVTKIEGAPLGVIQYKSLLSELEIKQLSAQTVGGLTVETLELQSSGTYNILKLLTASQIGGLTAGQINQLVDQFASLSSALQSQINFLTMTEAQFALLKAQTVGLSFLASSSKKHPSLKIAHLSATIIGGLDIDTLLMKINGKELIGLLTQEQLSSITSFQIGRVVSYLASNPTLYYVVPPELWFDEAITKDVRAQIMTSARMGELTAEQMKLFDDKKLSTFTDLQIQSLSLDAVGGLSAGQLSTRNSSGKTILSSLTKYQIPVLTASQINGLPFGGVRLEDWQISFLSANTISALSFVLLMLEGSSGSGHKLAYSLVKDQMGAITALQLNILASGGRDDDDNEENFLKNLFDRNQIQHLSLATVSGLSGQALSASARGIAGDTLGDLPILATLIPSQIPEGGLAGFQLDGLNVDVFEVMTREQISRFLSADAVSGLSTSALKKVCKSGITVFEALSDTQIQGLRTDQFKDLLPSLQVDKLADHVINNLSVDCLLEVINKLSDSQLYALAPKQITLLLASNSALIAKGDKAAISERSLLAILGNADDLSFFGGLNLGSQQYAISRLTSADITQFVPQYVIQSLPVSVLNQMTADGKLIASVVYKSLSKKQIGELTPDVLGNPVSDGGDSTSILMKLTSSQISGLTVKQIKGLKQSLRSDLFKDPSKMNSLDAKIDRETYEKFVPIVWTRSTYGQNASDFGFRTLQATNLSDMPQTGQLFQVLKGQADLNMADANNNNLPALRAQVEAFKKGTIGVPRILISAAFMARILAVASTMCRWSERFGYGNAKIGWKNFTQQDIDRINSASNIAPAVTNLLQATILFVRADKEVDQDKQDVYFVLGSASSVKAVATTLRAVRMLDSMAGYAAVMGAGDALALAGGIMSVVATGKPNPDMDHVGETYSYVEGIANMAGGTASLVAYIVAGIQKTSAIAAEAAAATAAAAAVAAGGSAEGATAAAAAAKAAAATKAGLMAARVANVIGGMLMIAAAANPLPFEAARDMKEAAEDLEDMADENKAMGSNYKGDYLYADYLMNVADTKTKQAAVDSSLMSLTGLAMMSGNPIMAAVLGVGTALANVFMEGEFEKHRKELGEAVKDAGGADKVITQSLIGQNKIYMNQLEKTFSFRATNLDQFTCIGGQTLSETVVDLLLEAAKEVEVARPQDDSEDGKKFKELEELFVDATINSMNFANVYTSSSDGGGYRSTSKVFEQVAYFDKTNMQYADLSVYIKRSPSASPSSLTTSAISFYSPLALPSRYAADTSGYEGIGTKETSIVKYLDMSKSTSGTVFNLSADDLRISEFVTIDLANLLVNYKSTDVDGDDKVTSPRLNNQMHFGNAQYYVYSSLANFAFKNANKFSGEGSAFIDYTDLGGTDYKANIHMVTGSSMITVYKDLDNSEGDGFYYQENNSIESTKQVGKVNVKARYLQFEKIEDESLIGQRDTIDGNSCVNAIIALKGEHNIMSGYNGMTLQGGGSGRYLFNRFSNNFNAGSAERPAEIHIMQGDIIADDGYGNIDSKLSNMNLIHIDSLLSVTNVYFYLEANLRDLFIINTETYQQFIVHDFIDNAHFNTIYLSSGSSSYRVNGTDLRDYFRSNVDELSLVIGNSVRANSSLLKKVDYTHDINFRMNTEVVVGDLYASNIDYQDGSLATNQYKILDYSEMNGSISVDYLNNVNSNLTIYKYATNGTQSGIDVIGGSSQVFGTKNSDQYLNIHDEVLISDSGGYNLFEMKKGGSLELSGLEGVSNTTLVNVIEVELNNHSSLYFGVDEYNNLHINSLDLSNQFSITIAQYGNPTNGAWNSFNLGLDFGDDYGPVGILNASSINRLVNAMAAIDVSTKVAADSFNFNFYDYLRSTAVA